MMLNDALIELMQKEHISKISVKALCEKADINRSTFYTHFSDPYDLLRYINKEVIKNIKNHLDEQHFDVKKPISIETLDKLLVYVKDNANLFKALLSDNCDPDIQREIMNELMVYQTFEGIDLRTKNYLAAYGLTGCISILQIWLKDGMPESTTRMAEIIIQVIDKGITRS
ncbi:MAG: TetR/AcrR family transcriptional regulator C-terminal domain-containing protein [Paludibacter sp.]|nr:TetR/AcrR family transcriptional regulator C-terminal domain-containing protein [Paludibacter sp.]